MSTAWRISLRRSRDRLARLSTFPISRRTVPWLVSVSSISASCSFSASVHDRVIVTPKNDNSILAIQSAVRMIGRSRRVPQ